MENEIWKPVINYEEFYEISNLGRFKIKERIFAKDKRGQRLFKEKIVEGCISGIVGNQYKAVTLSKYGDEKQKRVHVLVAIHFKENPYNLPFVNHIDYDNFNNKSSNLEWVSARENVCHGFKRVDKKSNYIGVTFSERNKNWIARTTVKGKRIHLGVFKDEKKAHEAILEKHKENGIINKYS